MACRSKADGRSEGSAVPRGPLQQRKQEQWEQWEQWQQQRQQHHLAVLVSHCGHGEFSFVRGEISGWLVG